MRTPTTLACVLICAAATAQAQPDEGLPGGPVRSGATAPAAITTASFVGAYALRGETSLLPPPRRARSTAIVEIRCREDGAYEVVREGTTWVAAGAPRRVTWSTTDLVLQGSDLRVTFRPRGEWVTGLAGALEGEGTTVTNENEVTAWYSIQRGELVESLTNWTRRPPEHFWSDAYHRGRALRREDRAPPARLTTLVDHGPQDARYDVVFVSEGYREEELPFFRADVRAAVAQLRATSPFTEYWPYLNVHRVDLASPGSGIRGGRGGGPGALGTKLEGGDPTDEWRMPSGSAGAVEDAVRRAGLKGADAVVVLVNDAFRSIAHTGYTFVSTWHDRPDRTVVHELGHVIGFLLDEYEENARSRWDFLMASEWAEGLTKWSGWGANVTTRTRRDDVPWRDWISPRVPLPTPAGSGHPVGLYVGGLHMSRGWHRPSETCLMRDEAAPFCVVCREAIILRLSQRSRPFELEVRRLDRDTVHLQVRTWIPGGGGARWSLGKNGHYTEVDGGVFVLRRGDASWGQSELELLVGDRSEWIRNDPMEWSLWRVRFVVDKGQVWTKGIKLSRPLFEPKREHGGEDLVRKFDRG